jgi:hypothetical protein
MYDNRVSRVNNLHLISAKLRFLWGNALSEG